MIGVFLENLWVPSIQGADQDNPDKFDSPLHPVMVVIPEHRLTLTTWWIKNYHKMKYLSDKSSDEPRHTLLSTI
jgi:hypothetical protein